MELGDVGENKEEKEGGAEKEGDKDAIGELIQTMCNMKTLRHRRNKKERGRWKQGQMPKVKVKGAAYSGFVVSIAAMR